MSRPNKYADLQAYRDMGATELAAFLVREPSTEQGTPGTLTFIRGGDELLLHTIELPIPIPASTYWTSPYYSPKHRRTLPLLHSVPGHEGVELHRGNFAGDITLGWQSDSQLCILVGLSAGKLNNESGNPQLAVRASHLAEDQMLLFIDTQSFWLDIKDAS